MNTLSLDIATLQQAWDHFVQRPAKLTFLANGVLRLQFQTFPLMLDFSQPELSHDGQTLRLAYQLHLSPSKKTDRTSGLLSWLSARLQGHLPALIRLFRRLGITVPPGVEINHSHIHLRLAAFPLARWLPSIQIRNMHFTDHTLMIGFELNETFYEQLNPKRSPAGADNPV